MIHEVKMVTRSSIDDEKETVEQITDAGKQERVEQMFMDHKNELLA